MDKLYFYSDQTADSKIVASLERISQAFRVLLWQQSKEFSLTPIQVQTLIFLLHHTDEKRKVSYLAKEFNITKATVSETIKTIEQKGLIIKENEVLDSRSYIIHLTEKGKEIAEQASSFAHEIYTPIYKLAQRDKENLLVSLINIIGHLHKNEIISIQRMCTSCSHFQPVIDKNRYFCAWLNRDFHDTDWRIDCPEHETMPL